jgi:hypothetical protein
LVKDGVTADSGTSSKANGIYYIAAAGDIGSGSTPWKLTRAADNDNSVAGELAAGDFTFVLAGTTNANQGFVMTTKGTGTPTGTIKIGTDGVKYSQFSGTSLTGSAPISVSGNVISVSNASTSAVGVASFSNSQFTVTSGAVSISALSGSVISGNISGNAANVTGTVAIANGGTGATTAALARTALGYKTTGTLNFSSTTVASVNHGLGQWVTAQAFDGSGNLIDMDVQNTSTGSGTTIYTVSATSASATNYTYVIVG